MEDAVLSAEKAFTVDLTWLSACTMIEFKNSAESKAKRVQGRSLTFVENVSENKKDELVETLKGAKPGVAYSDKLNLIPLN